MREFSTLSAFNCIIYINLYTTSKVALTTQPFYCDTNNPYPLVIIMRFNFSRPDWVSLDWFMQFTSYQTFQCVNTSIMNGCARLWYSFIKHNHHQALTSESWTDSGNHSMSTLPMCQHTHIMNGCARLRFKFIKHNHHQTLTFESLVI